MERDHAFELEWQFDAPDPSAVEQQIATCASDTGFAVRDLGTSPQHDTYLDTDRWHVYLAGYALRERVREGNVETTLKALTPQTDGAARRLEVTEARELDAARRDGQGPVGERLARILGGHALHPVAEVRTQRRRWCIASDRDLVEVALDAARLGRSGAPADALSHVEIEEIATGGLSAAAAFVDRFRTACALTPAIHSKFEAALEAAGARPGPPDLGATRLATEDRAVDRAYAVLRRRFRDLLAHESGTALGEDPEALHQMRVATRRLRAALTVFAPVLPAHVVATDQTLRWFGRAVGCARDLDVQLAYLERVRTSEQAGPSTSLDPLIACFEGRRALAREELLAVLSGDRYRRFVAESIALLRAGPDGDAPMTATAEIASKAIRREFKRVRRGARRIRTGSPLSEYHLLRIRAKRLRYSLELFKDLHPKAVTPARRSLRRLQDQLGALQDLSTLDDDLVAVATDEAGALPAPTLIAVGRLLEQHRAHRDAIIDASPPAIERVLGTCPRVRAAFEATAATRGGRA